MTPVSGTLGQNQGSSAIHPPAPRTLEESGSSHNLLTQLILKLLHFGADYSGHDIAHRLGLEYSVIEPVLDFLRLSHQCEVFGGEVGGPSFRYRITDAGRRRALLFLEQSHYVGVAPVPLASYRQYMAVYRRTTTQAVSRTRVREALSHLVLRDKVIDQLGPAVAAGHSMFVYGPPGNGKTVIARAIRELLAGDIAIPHAIEADGHIIRVFDPVNHEPLPSSDSDSLLLSASREDRRWVRCRRPSVIVGGELTLQSLDLAYSPTMGFYTAPAQMMANGGVLVIDDFGRQHCSPRELLNRWIVPLESGVDYLTLQTGHKLDVPFHVMVVFATNMKPSELVDEAFLRRIQFKVLAESPTLADFKQIFESCCRKRGLAYDDALVDALLAGYYRPRKIALRGCHPRDLIDQAMARAEYFGAPRCLTLDLLEAACASYFVDDAEHVPVYA